MNSRFGFVKVAVGSFEVSVGEPMINSEEIIKVMEEAQKKNIEVLLFPELTLTGYTCADLFVQSYMTRLAEEGLQKILNWSKSDGKMITIIGLPLRRWGKLFNAAVIIQGDKILGVVPKSHLPNYSEFYEKRWFSSADARIEDRTVICGQDVPFSPDIIIETPSGIRLSCEICEDLWVSDPPSSDHTLYGANIVVNLSASNEFATKSQYRRDLVKMQSAKCICGYMYASSGMGESTTDLVFSGHNIIASNGAIEAEEKYGKGLLTAILDIEKLENDRVKFKASSRRNDKASFRNRKYTTVQARETKAKEAMPDYVDPSPFIPDDEQKEERCQEIFQIQTIGLSQRLKNTGIQKTVVGISGGQDSTLALLVAVEAHKMINLPLENIVAITMPGFGTSEKTKENSLKLMELMGVDSRIVDIRASCEQHMRDIGHDPRSHDVVYENIQARERMQILMDVANSEKGIVVGTGDLSELALGWSTYNGDHMSMYGVNSGVPKTLINHLISFYGDKNEELKSVLESICNTVISPELVPAESGGKIQSTEETIGKYELHDFFLYHFVRNSFSKEKIRQLAYIAFSKTKKSEIDETLDIFFRRFFRQQFKRSCLPDGPKVGTVSLSPRGDWRMPSDVGYPED